MEGAVPHTRMEKSICAIQGCTRADIEYATQLPFTRLVTKDLVSGQPLVGATASGSIVEFTVRPASPRRVLAMTVHGRTTIVDICSPIWDLSNQ